MKLITLVCSILFTVNLFSQQHNIWYFGQNAGITFNSGSPVALTNGVLSTTEGVATISNASGNLLFYTDGVTVYNRNHVVMTNGTGLFGDASSTQSAIIVQQPGASNIYYIFTSDNDVGPNGICYSIVDMSLSSGLGAVTVKNFNLVSQSCEKLCAIRHCNNQDMWVVSHDWNSNIYRTWCVTSGGVNIYAWALGNVIPSGITQSAYGQMKASFDGEKIATCYYGFGNGTGTNRIEICDFDKSTGFVSNCQVLSTEIGIYGCEFSPNGNILYASTNGGILLQWNLSSGILATIQATRRVVANTGPFMGSLQIAPDNKIYLARNQTSLSVINNPNIYGIGCGYSDLSIPLLGRSSRMGLPNFAPEYIYIPILNSN